MLKWFKPPVLVVGPVLNINYDLIVKKRRANTMSKAGLQ